MSYPTDEPRLDLTSVSKVKLTRNSKGDNQWEISVVEGCDEHELQRLRKLAVAQHNALLDEFYPRP